MKLQKDDICRIGFDYVRTEVDTLEIMSLSTDRLEEILLRNILLEFGDYRIVDYIYYENDSNSYRGYVTNLPCILYENALNAFLEYCKGIVEANGYDR